MPVYMNDYPISNYFMDEGENSELRKLCFKYVNQVKQVMQF